MTTRTSVLMSLVLSSAVACSTQTVTTPPNLKTDTEPGSDSSVDADGDGIAAADDCDDGDAAVYPGAAEWCDGVDNDCDGVIDPESSADASEWHVDSDGDGFGDPLNTVMACELPAGAADNDQDCDDADAAIHPDALEVCDTIDNDCDTRIDDEDDDLDTSTATAYHADVDGDGFGDADVSVLSCVMPSGFVEDDTDCNDAAETANPEALEICDDLDNDCDGLIDLEDDSVDESTVRTFYADEDGDGYGVVEITTVGCSLPSGFSTEAGDCDDDDADISPGATEVCDDVDNDCDGLIDDDDDSTDPSTGIWYYPDTDRDGYGNSADPGISLCDPPGPASVLVTDATDCDDTDADIHPGATEVCDPDDVDEDCNGLADDDDAGVDPDSETSWYEDGDGDGYGAGAATGACEDPTDATTTYVADDRDCDDGDAAISPAATEVCDEIDNDCDSLIDDDDDDLDVSTATGTYYVDADGDGYGDETDAGTPFCDDPGSGYDTDATDCDDGDGDIHPGATEVCDLTDWDCDGDPSVPGEATWLPQGATVADYEDYTSDLGSGSTSAVDVTFADSGTLYVCAGTWYVNTTVSSNVNLVVTGVDGSAAVILDGASSDRIFDVESDATLELNGLTLQNGAKTGGKDDGGAVKLNGATLDGEDLIFQDNEAGEDGGAVWSNRRITLTNATFTDNSTADKGGAIRTEGDGSRTLTLTGCTFERNAAEDGGAIWTDDESILTSCAFNTNEASDDGGALGTNESATLISCTFDSNTATNGGAIWTESTSTLSSCAFNTNEASDNGGALWTNEHATLTSCTFDSNTATNGGAVYLSYLDANLTCSVTYGDFKNNEATEYGGAMYGSLKFANTKLNVTDTVFGQTTSTTPDNNTAGSEGDMVSILYGGTTLSYDDASFHDSSTGLSTYTCSGGNFNHGCSIPTP